MDIIKRCCQCRVEFLEDYLCCWIVGRDSIQYGRWFGYINYM